MAALVVGALAGAGWAVTSVLTPDERPAASRYTATVSRTQDPAWVAQRATQARFDAWQNSNAEQLVKWTAEGSVARAEAEATAQALASGRMVVEGLTATITSVIAQPTMLSDADGAVVTVSYTLSEHTVTLDGVETRFDSYAQTVDLELVRGIAGWRVASATLRETQA